MNGLMAIGALVALAAQNQQEDPVEQRVRRAKEQLQLTDEQTAKAREIYKKQYDDLRSILTDEQKKRYDEPNRGGGRGGQGNAPQGFGRTGSLPSTDELKAQLSLTDDQVTRVNDIRNAAREEFRNLARNRRPGGGGGSFTDAFTKIREETNKKIRDVLTEEQKPKFDDIVKAAQSSQDRGAGGGGRRSGTPEERVAAVMERLKVEDAKEAEAIKGAVKAVVELMDKLEAYQREARGKLDEASRNKELSDQAIGDKIEESRKAQRDIEKELANARKELAEVVTNRQEVELLREGILR